MVKLIWTYIQIMKFYFAFKYQMFFHDFSLADETIIIEIVIEIRDRARGQDRDRDQDQDLPHLRIESIFEQMLIHLSSKLYLN
jgi:hypothetical protein